MNSLKSSTNAIRLDPRRLEQFKSIGQKLGLSNAGLVSHLVREKIAAGIIPADIPGVIVEAFDGGIRITIDGGKTGSYSFAAARKLSATIRAVVSGKDKGVFDLDDNYAVMRRGAGYMIAAPWPGREVVFTGDLLIDLADIIDRTRA